MDQHLRAIANEADDAFIRSTARLLRYLRSPYEQLADGLLNQLTGKHGPGLEKITYIPLNHSRSDAENSVQRETVYAALMEVLPTAQAIASGESISDPFEIGREHQFRCEQVSVLTSLGVLKANVDSASRGAVPPVGFEEAILQIRSHNSSITAHGVDRQQEALLAAALGIAPEMVIRDFSDALRVELIARFGIELRTRFALSRTESIASAPRSVAYLQGSMHAGAIVGWCERRSVELHAFVGGSSKAVRTQS